MKNNPLMDDLELTKAFASIDQIPTLNPVMKQIARELAKATLTPKQLEEILSEHQLLGVKSIKTDLLDLVLHYINLVLDDHIISDKEYLNCKQLKMLFKIKEGEFLERRRDEIKGIIYKQLKLIYRDDNKIDDYEALHKVMLQGLFDLSYDQFLDFNEPEIRVALEKGADIKDLDTVRYPLDSVDPKS